MVGERLLQARPARPRREALDGRQIECPVGLDGEQHARLHGVAVEQHRAGAAVARVAADVGAGELAVVADEVDEQAARLDLALVDACR